MTETKSVRVGPLAKALLIANACFWLYFWVAFPQANSTWLSRPLRAREPGSTSPASASSPASLLSLERCLDIATPPMQMASWQRALPRRNARCRSSDCPAIQSPQRLPSFCLARQCCLRCQEASKLVRASPWRGSLLVRIRTKKRASRGFSLRSAPLGPGASCRKLRSSPGRDPAIWLPWHNPTASSWCPKNRITMSLVEWSEFCFIDSQHTEEQHVRILAPFSFR